MASPNEKNDIDLSQEEFDSLSIPNTEDKSKQQSNDISSEYDDTSHQDGEESLEIPEEILEKKTPADDVPAKEGVGEDAGEEEKEEQFPEYLLKAAGINAEMARKQFQTPEALQSAVRLLDERLVGTQIFQEQKQQQQTKKEEIPANDVEEFKLPELAEGEEWDESTRKLVESLNKYYSNRLKKQDDVISKQLKTLEQMAETRQTETGHRYVEVFDGFVEGLGDEWKSTFGEGPGYNLPRESLFLQNRFHLDRVAGQLRDALATRGQELPHEQILYRALPVAFPEQQKTAVQREVREEVAKRGAMKISRPTQRQSKPITREESAARNVEKWYSDRGMTVAADDFDYDTI